MKVLLINSVHYIRGGADQVYFNTGRLLKEHGHEVFYFGQKSENSIPDKYDYFFPKREDIRAGGISQKIKKIIPFIYNKEAARLLDAYLNEIKPDIAHIHLFMGGLSSSILKILKKHKIPIVHTAHDYRLICPAYAFLDKENHICERCKKTKYYNCILQQCSRGSLLNSLMLTLDAYFRRFFFKPEKYIDKIIFVSQFSQNKHKEYYPQLKKHIHLYNYNNISQLPQNTKKNYLLYFGRISVEKGIKTLLSAIDSIDYKLKVVGAGEQELDKFSANVEFMDFLTGKKLEDIIKHAKFVIVPSEWYENNPMTIIESYSLGVPVIASNVGGIPEIVTDGETGFLFKTTSTEDLKNKIEKALQLTDLSYNRMREKAYNFATSNFSNKTHYNTLIDIYKSITK